MEQLLVYIEELEGTNAQLREQPELQPVAEGQNDLHKLVSKLEEELEVAEELEAQWERTEKTEKRMSRLQEENDELKHQVGDLRGDFDKQGLRIEELEELNRELDAQAAQHIQQLEAEHEEVHKLFQFCSLMVD
jgi:predicted  nucleic acid-binding Zn-ribbon protein